MTHDSCTPSRNKLFVASDAHTYFARHLSKASLFHLLPAPFNPRSLCFCAIVDNKQQSMYCGRFINDAARGDFFRWWSTDGNESRAEGGVKGLWGFVES